MRPSCLRCVRKHLAQAVILFTEARCGYENHFAYALGHMAEAEAEAVEDYEDFAGRIRSIRIGFEYDNRANSTMLGSLVSQVTFMISKADHPIKEAESGLPQDDSRAVDTSSKSDQQ